jgi:hypothetical protein
MTITPAVAIIARMAKYVAMITFSPVRAFLLSEKT